MKRTLLAAALLATVGAANAAVVLTGGTYISFSNYDVASLAHPNYPHTAPQTTGLMDPVLSGGPDHKFTATFLGKEAGHIDQFWVNGSLVFNNLASVPSTYGPFAAAAPMNFKFRDYTDGSEVPNGGNLLAFASYVVLGTQSGSTFTPYTDLGNFDFVLGFNDGSKIDADYDDLVVGFKVTAVPEPETYALLLAGLGVMGFVARRRRND
jgi:hypothetical protein